MRRARWAAAVAAMAIGAFVAIPAAPGGAQVIGNTITVEKVVDGTAPEGTVFKVIVDCASNGDTTVYFDENGHPSDKNGDSDPGSNVVDVDAQDSDICTVSETVDGGASSTTYDCDVDNDAVTTFCTEDNEVTFDNTIESGATVTVTNTFEEAPTTTTTTTMAPTTTTVPVKPASAPVPVQAAARFTG